MWTLDLYCLLAAVALDFIIGDPRRMPHLARWSGSLISLLEPRFRRHFGNGIAAGGLFALSVTGIMLLAALLLILAASSVYPPLAWILQTLLLYQCIAARDLIAHVTRVLNPLREGDIATARQHLSWIVGRDTAQLDEEGISRAAIETTAESFHDGFVGPLFWAVLLGPLGALLFRVVNTLDSMVGHRDERYLYFGRFSARADDVLGFLPARVSALLLAPRIAFTQFTALRHQAHQHASPNAGWTEAAMALECGIRLGGANDYSGERLDGPVFNPQGLSPDARSIRQAIHQFWRAWIRTVLAAAGVVLLISQIS